MKDLERDIGGRDVTLVEDMWTPGSSLRYVLQHLRQQGPASLKGLHATGPPAAAPGGRAAGLRGLPDWR